MTSPKFPYTALLLLGISPFANAEPTLTKLHDFYVPPVNPDNPNPLPGTANPYDTPLLIGNTLWFTTQNGGIPDAGTLSSFDLGTNTVTLRVEIDGSNGDTPQGSPELSDGFLYYTTNSGGTGDRGVLNAYELATGTNTTLWHALLGSPAATYGTNPGTMGGNVAIVDRGGELGKDIYIATQNGGPGGAARGTILRYQTSDGSITVVKAFGDAPGSRQPFKGFTKVGNKLYFTTFTGGNTTTGTSNGAGTLNELDVTTRDAEVYTQLALMPLGDGSTRLPAHNPYYRSADHSLYFTTSGIAVQPGSLMKFDLSTNVLSSLYELEPLTVGTTTTHPQGRLPYGSVIEWNRALYFTTTQGGANNGGTINRYNLDNGTFEVLFNLNSDMSDNTGGEPRGGFVFNNNPSNPAFYLLARQGGIYDKGTILRLDLDPALPSSTYTQWLATRALPTDHTSVPEGDADHDGIPNKVEFAFGTDPDSGSGAPLSTAEPTESGLEIRWTARTDGSVIYQVEGSPTLGAAPSPWTGVAAVPETMAVPDIAVPTGYERRRVTLSPSEAAGFFRVEGTFLPGTLP